MRAVLCIRYGRADENPMRWRLWISDRLTLCGNADSELLPSKAAYRHYAVESDHALRTGNGVPFDNIRPVAEVLKFFADAVVDVHCCVPE